VRAPDRYPSWQPIEVLPALKVATVTPTVYPLDDQVKEKLLGPDGKPVNEGTARKYPIGFHRHEAQK